MKNQYSDITRKQLKSDIISRSILLMLTLLLIFIIANVLTYELAALISEPSELFYTIRREDMTFDVIVDSIKKEKGKEDLYEYTLKDGVTELKFYATKSGFNNTIGVGNNAVSSSKYTLELAIAANNYSWVLKPKHNYYSIELYRYSVLGDIEFTKEDIDTVKEYAASVLNEVNYNNERPIGGVKDSNELGSEALIIKNRLNAKNAHIICGGAGTSLDGFEKVSIK